VLNLPEDKDGDHQVEDDKKTGKGSGDIDPTKYSSMQTARPIRWRRPRWTGSSQPRVFASGSCRTRGYGTRGRVR